MNDTEALHSQIEKLRLAQVELNASRARYADLYELAPVGYITLSAQGLIQDANLMATTQLGVTRGELIGIPITHFIPQEDQASCHQRCEQLFRSSHPLEWSQRMVPKVGMAFWAHLVATTAKGVDDAQEIRVVITNIAKRKQAEESLRESEEKHRLLFECAGDAILLHDKEGRIRAANSPACERFGYTRDELLSMTVGQIDSPEDAAQVPDRMVRLIEQGHLSFETVHLRKDGSPIPTEVNVRCVTWDGQSAMLSVCRDISERKQAEEALQQEHQFSRSLLDSLPGIFYLYTYPQLQLVLWNKQHESIFGYSDTELKGRHVTQWFSEEAKGAVLDAIEEVMEKGRSSMEAILMKKGGDQVHFSLIGVKFEEQGQSYLMGIGIDISDRKKAEEALQAALNDIKTLRGIIPICAWCKKIRDDHGSWNQVEVYVREHTEAEFSHGICPECKKKMHAEIE